MFFAALITYVVLGDSTAAGVGAPYESGIAAVTARHLAEKHRITMTNLGISGAKLEDVVRDQLPAAELLKPDLVLLSASANDVIRFTPVSSMRRSLLEIVRRLRAANPKVIIVITGSPDMGAPPRIPRLLRPLATRRTRNANAMFMEIARKERLFFAPIAEETGPLLRADPTMFHPDRFHPNARGYATWIVVLNRVLGEALR